LRTIKILGGQLVRELITIDDLTVPMRDALTKFSAGEVFQHPRVTVEPGGGSLLLLMPAGTESLTGLKILTMYPGAASAGLPSVQGLVVLVDATTGEPLALLDGAAITELRTAAVSAVATDRLARADATSLAIIGAGVQAAAHVRALATIRPWRSIRIYSRSAARVEKLVALVRAEGIDVTAVSSAAEAVREADVVCTTTSACSPVFEDADTAAGAHITAVGAFGPTCRELPSALVARAELFADSREAVLAEAGDILTPMAEGLVTAESVTEIGDVFGGRHPGRADENQTTVFKSLGLPIEDVVACGLVYRRAVAEKRGEDVSIE
jgi:ornithine cyclodeaminase/alanine dehydrogenase-like protein (mu-crystallin family)